MRTFVPAPCRFAGCLLLPLGPVRRVCFLLARACLLSVLSVSLVWALVVLALPVRCSTYGHGATRLMALSSILFSPEHRQALLR